MDKMDCSGNKIDFPIKNNGNLRLYFIYILGKFMASELLLLSAFAIFPTEKHIIEVKCPEKSPASPFSLPSRASHYSLANNSRSKLEVQQLSPVPLYNKSKAMSCFTHDTHHPFEQQNQFTEN